MKEKPTVVTPTAAVGTPNPFAALAEAEDTTEPAETALEIPNTDAALEISENKYLPNQVAQELQSTGPQSTGQPVTNIVPVPVEDTDPTSLVNSDLSLSSISTMSSTDDGNEFSKAKISALVERIKTNIT